MPINFALFLKFKALFRVFPGYFTSKSKGGTPQLSLRGTTLIEMLFIDL